MVQLDSSAVKFVGLEKNKLVFSMSVLTETLTYTGGEETWALGEDP